MTYKILFVFASLIAFSSISYIIYNETYHSHPHSRDDNFPQNEKMHTHDNHSHEEEHESHNEAIHWSKEKIETANIQLQSAASGYIQNVIRAPGRILIHPNDIAYIIPNVGGSVKILRKEQGDFVKEDEVLAVLESKEIAEAKSAYLATLKKLELKRKILEKEKGLRKISPEQDYLQAQAAVEEASIEAELAKQNLYTLGLDNREIAQIPQLKGEYLRLYEIRSPIEGQVIQRDLTIGEQIDNKRKVYTIADFNRVRAEFNINQKNSPNIQEGQEIEISSPDGLSIKTTIFHVQPIINEETRSAIAVANINNRSKQWIPGKFVTAIIKKEAEFVPLLVPKEAIQKIKGQEVIFIFDKDTFSPRVVKTGKSDEKNIEITSGLQIGEKYASNNTFILKADLEKSEAEHSHTH